jgi:carbamoyl-phosphate synthase large subunit
MNRLNLLIPAVGSVVGQNILNVLDYPGFSRRALVRVVGTNSIADAPSNFRCDRCYLVPETASADHPARMRDILREEKPDLILCARDADIYALAELKAHDSAVPGRLPIGSPHAALIGYDKWQTFLFARRHQLPFPDSFAPGESGDAAALMEFCRRVGYPLVAKPRRGFGSLGVYFLRNADDAAAMARPDYLLQEYLGDPRALEEYCASLVGPAPLIAQAPNAGYHATWTMIAPDGALAPIMATDQPLFHGYAVENRRVLDPDLHAITVAYARALHLEGGSGPLNIAFRRDRRGAWSVPEINLRNTGGTLSRFLLGHDELYHIVRAFAPGFPFPELCPMSDEPPNVVRKLYSAHPLNDSAITMLQETGTWPSPAEPDSAIVQNGEARRMG